MGTVYAEHVAQVHSVDSKWQAKLQLGNIDVNFKLDTGADTNIISQQMYNQLQPLPAVGKSPVTLRAFDGQRIESI